MKKILSLVLVLALCLPLCACGSNANNSTFTYQHDQWNLYKAVPLSATTFKIENWGRYDAAVDGDPFEYEYDVCVISTEDTSMNFKWFDDSHTAFSISLTDEKNSYMEGTVTAYFTAEAPKADAGFAYQHDRFNLYKVVPLSATTFKIENWGRLNSGVDGDPFKHYYDVGVISTEDTSMNFKWLDDSHTAFSISLYDEKNSYWQEEQMVTFAVTL